MCGALIRSVPAGFGQEHFGDDDAGGVGHVLLSRGPLCPRRSLQPHAPHQRNGRKPPAQTPRKPTDPICCTPAAAHD
eukprot:1644575-Rhodomonas_salina.3